MKKQALPVWALPAAGAAIGGTAGLLGGINIDDPRITPSIRAKKLLRCLLLGGVTGLGLEGMRQGGKLIFKQSSYKPKGYLLRDLLLKQAEETATPPADPAATTGAGTGNSWFSGDTWGVPNHYLVGGSLGALGGLTLYHLLNDKRKRNASGYLGSALAGLGVGALGAGVYRMANGYGWWKPDNIRKTDEERTTQNIATAELAKRDAEVRNPDGTLNVKETARRAKLPGRQSPLGKWISPYTSTDQLPDTELADYNAELARQKIRYSKDFESTTGRAPSAEELKSFEDTFTTQYIDWINKNGFHTRANWNEEGDSPVELSGIKTKRSIGEYTQQNLNNKVTTSLKDSILPTVPAEQQELIKTNLDSATREINMIVRDAVQNKTKVYPKDILEVYTRAGIQLNPTQKAQVVREATNMINTEHKFRVASNMVNNLINQNGATLLDSIAKIPNTTSAERRQIASLVKNIQLYEGYKTNAERAANIAANNLQTKRMYGNEEVNTRFTGDPRNITQQNANTRAYSKAVQHKGVYTQKAINTRKQLETLLYNIQQNKVEQPATTNYQGVSIGSGIPLMLM